MKKEMRKKYILEYAKKYFSSRGYYETHIEDIISDAKIGKGTFYRYFKNKEELFISLLVEFLNEWEDFVFKDLLSIPPANYREFMHTLVFKSLTFFRTYEDLCNIYLRIAPGLSTIFGPYINSFEDKMLGHFKNVIEDGRAKGYMRDNLDLEFCSNVIAGAFLRIDYYYFVLRYKNDTSLNVHVLADRLIDVLIGGLGSAEWRSMTSQLENSPADPQR
jgi:AcrR family transcriptional regulator